MELYKRYVDVILLHRKTGEIVPLYIVWADGRRYRVDKIRTVEKRASEVGGGGIRYTCMIQGKERNLFLEKDRWFIESTRA